eukprot:6204276-Pleurochrysis_carterae.AAC.1
MFLAKDIGRAVVKTSRKGGTSGIIGQNEGQGSDTNNVSRQSWKTSVHSCLFVCYKRAHRRCDAFGREGDSVIARPCMIMHDYQKRTFAIALSKTSRIRVKLPSASAALSCDMDCACLTLLCARKACMHPFVPVCVPGGTYACLTPLMRCAPANRSTSANR